MPLPCDPGANSFVERFLHDCVYTTRDLVGLTLGLTSIVLWIVAQVPQFLDNIKNQSAEALSVWFLGQWFLGDTLNLLGCLLSGQQLPTTVALAGYFVLSDVAMLIQFIYYLALSKRRQAAARRAKARRAAAGEGGSSHGHHGGAGSRNASKHGGPGRNPSKRGSSDAPRGGHGHRTAGGTGGTGPGHHVPASGSGGSLHGGSGSKTNSSSSIVPQEDVDCGDCQAQCMASANVASNGAVQPQQQVAEHVELLVVLDSEQQQPAEAAAGAPAARQEQLHAQQRSCCPSHAQQQQQEGEEVEEDQEEEGGQGLADLSRPLLAQQQRTQRTQRCGSSCHQAATSHHLHQQLRMPWVGLGRPQLVVAAVGVCSVVGLVAAFRTSYAAASPAASWQHPAADQRHLQHPLEAPRLALPALRWGEASSSSSSGSGITGDQASDGSLHEEGQTWEQLLGTVFGYCSTTLYLTSRISQLYKNWARRSAEGLSVAMFLFTIAANLCTGLSIILRLEDQKQFIAQLPWIAGALGTVGLDTCIFLQARAYNSMALVSGAAAAATTAAAAATLIEAPVLVLVAGAATAAAATAGVAVAAEAVAEAVTHYRHDHDHLLPHHAQQQLHHRHHQQQAAADVEQHQQHHSGGSDDLAAPLLRHSPS